MPHEIISARDAAKRLKRTTSTVEQGLRAGTFPVGTCYKTAAGRFVYIIPRDAFERFLRGEIVGRRPEPLNGIDEADTGRIVGRAKTNTSNHQTRKDDSVATNTN